MQGYLDLYSTPPPPLTPPTPPPDATTATSTTTTTTSSNPSTPTSLLTTTNNKKFFFILDPEQKEIRYSMEQLKTIKNDPQDCQRWYFHEIKSIQKLTQQNDNNRTLRLVIKDQYIFLKAPSESLANQWYEAILKYILPKLIEKNDKKIIGSAHNKSSSSYNYYILLPLFTLTLHLIVTPYTKVEESFNTHAIHDLITYPTGIVNQTIIETFYDHVLFPGVVPRTFWGAAIISSCAFPLVVIFSYIISYGGGGVGMTLFIVRFTLAVLVWLTFVYLNSKAQKRFVELQQYPWILPLLYASQFHFNFYGSRFLPNVFALATCQLAWGNLLDHHPYTSIAWFIFTTTVLRCDVLVLLAPIAFWIWFMDTRRYVRDTNIHEPKQGVVMELLLRNGIQLASWGFICFIISLCLDVALDTRFWKVHESLLPSYLFPTSILRWPEGEVLWFNVVENKSAHWGTSPWYWYFTNALPKMLMIGFPFSFVGFIMKTFVNVNSSSDRDTALLIQRIFIPTLIFVMLYSFLPHKEVRFLFPAIPVFNVLGAIGFIQSMKLIVVDWKIVSKSFMIGVIVSSLTLCFMISCGFLMVSSYNYPGGEAVVWLENQLLSRNNSEINSTVHIDAYSAMNGVSLFLYDTSAVKKQQVKWYKTPEDLGGEQILHNRNNNNNNMEWKKFNYLVWESRDDWNIHVQEFTGTFHPLQCFHGEPRIHLKKLFHLINNNGGEYKNWIETRKVICVYERHNSSRF
jgi:alpha-1,6-mannosyltransferase